MKLHAIITVLVFQFHLAGAQNINDSLRTQKWGISLNLGLNTSSTNSTYLNSFSPNWGLGVLRNFGKGKITHSIQFKFSQYQESFKGLPYYYLDKNRNLISTTYTQKNNYKMLFLGWNAKYELTKRIIIQGGLGFNYLLNSSFNRKFSDKTETQSRREPSNYFFSRPELSIGIGYKKAIGNTLLIFKPTYTYNFTLNYGNLAPSFHSIGIETQFNF